MAPLRRKQNGSIAPKTDSRRSAGDGEYRRHLELHSESNCHGADSFAYVLNDGSLDSKSAAVYLTITR